MIKSFIGKNKFLSNYYPEAITYQGKIYKNLHSAYLSALIVINTTIDVNIITNAFINALPSEANRLYRKFMKQSNSYIDYSSDTDFNILKELLKIKFNNEELKQKLIDTNDEELINVNSWNDQVLGCIIDPSDNTKFVGDNILGKLLMELRSDFLKKSDADIEELDTEELDTESNVDTGQSDIEELDTEQTDIEETNTKETKEESNIKQASKKKKKK